MAKSTKESTRHDRWENFQKIMPWHLPHLMAWLRKVENVDSVRLKWRDDGTVIAMAKGYDSAGGPIVCFGSGWDFEQALIALDLTIQAGNWKVDKPWQPKADEKSGKG